MRCPFCDHDDDRVVDSRLTDDGTAIRRRRQCNQCSARFTTYERIEGEEQVRVLKSDGSLEPFDRAKILHGLMIACRKRSVSSEDLEGAVNRIYQSFIGRGEREISSRAIGEMVMEELRLLDEVAYVRFASVYRKFKDLDDFMSELRQVIGEGKHASDGGS